MEEIRWGSSTTGAYHAAAQQRGSLNNHCTHSDDQRHVVHEFRPLSPVWAHGHAKQVQNFALSYDRPSTSHGKHASKHQPAKQQRPQTAPGGLRSCNQRQSPGRHTLKQFGQLSLYDREHAYLGPKVLRDWQRSIGSPSKCPENYLKQGEGQDLKYRNNLAQWLKRNPVNREPPFQPGEAGIKLSWDSVPEPNTLFRYLYDNGTIDFVAVRDGGLTNHIVWGKQVRAGLHSWDRRPDEVQISKWLPIFLEGIREHQEPYRFLAVRGSESLMCEAGSGLHAVAADCVPPLRKALETREPTTVALALELILLALRIDTKVATVWIYHLWQFAQIMNLFVQRKYTVNMGYNKREYASVKQLVFDVLLLLEEHGGEHATALIRRYCRGVDPAVTPASQQRLMEKATRKEGHQPWKPFTLF